MDAVNHCTKDKKPLLAKKNVMENSFKKIFTLSVEHLGRTALVLIKGYRDKSGALKLSQLALTKMQCYLKEPWEMTLFIQYKIITHGLSGLCQLRILHFLPADFHNTHKEKLMSPFSLFQMRKVKQSRRI